MKSQFDKRVVVTVRQGLQCDKGCSHLKFFLLFAVAVQSTASATSVAVRAILVAVPSTVRRCICCTPRLPCPVAESLVLSLERFCDWRGFRRTSQSTRHAETRRPCLHASVDVCINITHTRITTRAQASVVRHKSRLGATTFEFSLSLSSTSEAFCLSARRVRASSMMGRADYLIYPTQAPGSNNTNELPVIGKVSVWVCE